ncbi:hypothetical protein [Halorubrum sp. AJ67]|uniref:hypothetical protein n=1 Tax=Halorubrum sp. AJ67 TaxID=1173487 RepID=UPI0012ABEA8A|nr:hypothetical protein [Halorubrum sp. AJ67]
MPKRRSMLFGLGALAMGSGAAFSSAAFQNSVSSDADLRVVVEQNLTIGPGSAFDNIGEGGKFTDNPNLFNGQDLDERDSGAFDEDTVPPLAYVDGENEDLDVRMAVPLNDTTTFENILEIDGPVDETVNVGIAYDRFPDDGDRNQYGEDITLAGGSLSPEIARQAYQFTVNDDESQGGTRISPNNNAEGVGTDETVKQAYDRPADVVTVGPGETVSLDLDIDTQYYYEAIRGAADIAPKQFGFQRDTVQLIDGFTVGTMTGDNL